MNSNRQPASTRLAPGRLRAWEWLVLVTGLAIFAAQAWLASPSKSASFDEQYHLSAGYTYLRTGDFRLASTHPPLAGLLAALPLLQFDDIALPLAHPAWQTGDRFLFSDIFLWEANDNAPELLVQARQSIIVLGILLLIAVFLWARRLIGPYAAVVALLLAALDPNLVAHSRVVTTDMALTCFFFLATWALWGWLRRPNWLMLALTGLLAGLTMAAKYNGLLFWPVALFVVLTYPGQSRGVWRKLGAYVAMGLFAYTALWAVYRFDVGPVAGWPVSVSLPAPYYWEQLTGTFTRIMTQRDARLDFFLGEASAGGWWNYFLVALAVKTPLPTLILFGLGLFVMFRHGLWRRQSILWLPALLFLAIGSTKILNIGYRHILPALPFMIMLAGNTGEWARRALRHTRWQRRAPAYVTVLLIVWLALDALRFYPHQEAHFNLLAGSWPNWSNILVDSNLDWGQDLPALRDKMDELGIETVNLAYFGKGVPEAYGVRYRPLPGYLRFIEGVELNAYNPHTPEPGWYAISATALRLGLTTPETVDFYATFRELTPDARAGYSIYLYNLTYPEDTPVDRVPVVASNTALLAPEQLGIEPGRRVQIKWMQSPEAAIYSPGSTYALPEAGEFEEIGANFGDVFTLIGYEAPAATLGPGETLQLTLYWQVGSAEMPMPAPTRGSPISAFIHVTGEDAADIVAQFDGWRTALRGLEPGDIIVQHVDVPLPSDLEAGEYTIRAGLYSPQNGQRLFARIDEENADHVQLGKVRYK